MLTIGWNSGRQRHTGLQQHALALGAEQHALTHLANQPLTVCGVVVALLDLQLVLGSPLHRLFPFQVVVDVEVAALPLEQ
ncbi:MAG: hypothetical protein RIQ83_1934 [Pseudomonadota bacterium]|jgi:hypothetical protein